VLFNLAQTLRSLTTSPITTAVDQAHRMAQRRLEAGGPAVSARGRVGDHSGARDFVLPPDVDPVEVAGAIEAKLRGGRDSAHERGNRAHSVLATRPDGRVVVPAEMVQRLGEGMVDRGRRILDRIVGDIRGHRVLRDMK
jgi:hypothetical protein